ncbi:LysM peptidoglycan-binding domain-containing protein [Pontibacillus yanchengensis]|uniref:LysM peptidoglycan-binding domain-containing protein n=2 Tax=Pontibacillus yanchengensis TaxID=462910 RepID=A0A6I5A2J0_9BACI|nr:3D domain-containing protein [Pontibacillus yanchengensis]MYL32059.1 LysM peptidoglycan-binding domain-containing protein [Pontibacillus yanchengensis]MYL52638.1 LysM peptidoglycan-binding domain-containing protein [Pontibacillus yanchengensis]
MKKTILSVAAVATISVGTTVTASAEDVVVDKGDTLWGISQDYGVSVNDIKDINGLSSNTIYPNQTLTVNNREGNTTSEATTASANGTHTVQSGDTLWSIAHDNGVSVGSLKAWNNLSSNIIVVGQELVLNESSSAEVEQVESNTSQTETTTINNNTSADQQADDNVAKTVNVEATAYTAYCTGCSGVTSTGIDLRANPNRKVIAVDPDVIPLGSEVYVEGYGKAIAGDVGGAIQGNRIDVFIPNQSDALAFGRKNVEVTVYE